MKAKSFAVIGLGQFGMTLARELANADYDVLAIDDKDENIQEIAEMYSGKNRGRSGDLSGAFHGTSSSTKSDLQWF